MAAINPPATTRSANRGRYPDTGTAPPSPSGSCTCSSAWPAGPSLLNIENAAEPDNYLHLATGAIAVWFGTVGAGRRT